MPGSPSIWKTQLKKRYESVIQTRSELTSNNSVDMDSHRLRLWLLLLAAPATTYIKL